MTKKIRWVLAHEPYDLFLRAAEKFSSEIKQRTTGAVEIEVLSLSEFCNVYNNGVQIHRYDLQKMVNDGTIEMSQMYTTTLGQIDHNMYVMDLPFLFQDHEHAARVLDGEIGQELMTSLASKSNIKGLAFTYSGGFRAIVGNQVIDCMEDFEGLRVRVARSPVAEDTFTAVGAVPVPMPVENLAAAIENGDVDAGESTYPRIYSMGQNRVSTVINHTEHSLFLTTIIMNKALWDSLDMATQQIFATAAVSAAQIERQESLDDIEITQTRAVNDGITVTTMPESVAQQFRTAVQPVYEKYNNTFDNNLIDRIRKA